MEAHIEPAPNEYLSISPTTLLLCKELARRVPSQAPRATLQQLEHGLGLVYRVGDVLFDVLPGETLLDFLTRHLKYTLGKEWGKAERAKSPHQRHVLMRWAESLSELQRQSAGTEHVAGRPYEFTPTGNAMEWMSIADDVYRLRLVGAFRPKLIKRLRHPKEFQGARYECAIAASFVRTGFDIQWESGQNKKCEFVATQKLTGESIAVEVKSRRRPGTINEPGVAADPKTLHADVGRLYKEALAQCPADRPCAIFIDVNLPPRAEHDTNPIPWQEDLLPLAESMPKSDSANPSRETCIVFSSFGWHYSGNDPAKPMRSLYLFSPYVRHRITNMNTFVAIIRAIETYGDFGPPDSRPFLYRVLEPH